MTFPRRFVELAPGDELAVSPARWADTLVFVTAGEIEVECRSGGSARFACGSILCFSASVRVVRNAGREHARLLAVSRGGTAG